MSVINQMLKDLDKRQDSTAASAQGTVPVAQASKSPLMAIILTVIVTLAVVSVALLYVENKALKQDSITALERQSTDKKEINTGVVEKQGQEVVPVIKASSDIGLVDIKQPKNDNNKLASTASVVTSTALQKNPREPVSEPNLQTTEMGNTGKVKPVKKVTESIVSEIITTAGATASESSASSQPSTDSQNSASLSISRKKLSSTELAAKKMTQAEQAMLNNNVELAEQYFEEILLISPKHASARKQLAALLYGRQSIQEAINILSQGIQLTPDNSELRLMLARVYSEKGFNQQALNTLTPLADTPDVAYQSAIATSAQSLSAHQAAINAFSQLVTLEQGQSRWYLGLAVAYDRLGQYSQAVDAYQQAIFIGNLSESALTFAKQRTLELGES